MKSVKDLKSEGLTGGLTRGSGGIRKRRKSSQVTYAALGLGALFLGIAGFGYLRFATGERESDKAVIPAAGTTGVLQAKSDRFVFVGIDAHYKHYRRNKELGSIFILKGHVADTSGSQGKGRLLVHASLLGINNKPIAKKTVIAGIAVSEEELLTRDKDYIEQVLSGNVDNAAPRNSLTPGSPVPFMVVFFDVPKNVVNYALIADEGE